MEPFKAKLHKIELYVLDINEQTIDNLFKQITNCTDVLLSPFNTQTVEIDYTDQIDINYKDATIETYRKYFN